MAVAPTSPIGTTISIVAGSPATFDETGYDALTYAEIDGVQSIGELGDRSERISADTLKDGRRVYANGVKDFTPFTVTMLPDATDAGQIVVAAANNTDTLYSIVIEDPNGKQTYVTGRVADLVDNPREPGTVLGQTFEFRPAYAQVYGTA